MLTVPQLKKMAREAGLGVPSEIKDELMEAIVGYLLPGYPYANPFAKQVQPEEVQEVQEVEAEAVEEDIGALPMPVPVPMPGPVA